MNGTFTTDRHHPVELRGMSSLGRLQTGYKSVTKEMNINEMRCAKGGNEFGRCFWKGRMFVRR